MKNRGGKLRVWALPKGKKDEVSIPSSWTELEDFISVSGNSQGKFAMIRKNGASLSTTGGKLSNRADAKQIDCRQPSVLLGMTQDGNVLGNDEILAILGDDDDEVDQIACGNGLVYRLKKDGSIRLHWLPDVKHLRGREELLEKLRSTLISQKDFVSVAANNACGIALKADGTVLSWHPSYGFIDPPAGAKEIIEVACGDHFFSALTRSGIVITWTLPEWEDQLILPPPDLEKIVSLRAANFVGAAQKGDGSWFAWRALSSKDEDAEFTSSNDRLIEQINEAGPVIDLSFIAEKAGAYLYSIHPPES